MGNPHRDVKAIHISGTKGKGSVSSFINSILMEAGCRTGLYTSPHLISFRERIRINGEPISEEDVTELVDRIKPHLEVMGKKKDGKPTYFETCTMMAFLYFKEKNTDFMVLETGMGGRLDSTNIVEPLVSVITPISHDHTRHLGTGIKDIAYEKCGIIKRNSIVISSPQNPEAMEVIRRISDEKNSKLYCVGKEILFERLDSNLEGQNFNLITRYVEFPYLKTQLLGYFQVENAATAIAAVEALCFNDIFINSDAIRTGTRIAKWPGRFELIDKRPFIVVDGAQNAESATALKKSVKDTFDYKNLFLILGAMIDKDIDGICKELSSIADYVLATKSKSERACSPEILKEKMSNYKDANVTITDSVAEALTKGRKLAGEDDLILITGSLYVVAEAMEELKKE
ncbi:bifunctional folylpolyglutamate synthase/dihydrofolate synthase [bacterium]|nr:bifunctional folylpolyglutamate synthase/dihydrofolate synthase [bacterium]